MYHISKINDKFKINIQSEKWLEREDYLDLSNYLKAKYLSGFLCESRLQEVILWFERDKKEYTIDDDVSNYLQNLNSIYPRELEVYRNEVFDDSVISDNDKIIKFDYQLEDVKRHVKLSTYLNANDAGTGKTNTSIWVFAHHIKKNNSDAVLIISPTGLSYHWKKSILFFTSLFKDEDIGIVTNENKCRPYGQFRDKKIIIIPAHLFADTVASYRKDYDSLKSLKDIRWKSKHFVDIKKEWGKENIFFLVDEAHGIKNTSAIRTKACFHLKNFFKYRVLLTATPWINGIEDSFSLLTFIDHSIIPMEEDAFRLWIGKDIGTRFNSKAIVSYNTDNVKTLMTSYKNIFFQRLKEDTPEIKTKRFINPLYVEMNSIQKSLYQKIVEKELHILEGEYDKITWRLLLTKFHLLLEVFDNPLLLKNRHYDDVEIMSLLNKWKIEVDPKFIALKSRLENYIDDLNEKVIVYDVHPDTIDILSEKFKKYNPLVIHGRLKVKDKEKDRQEKEDLFNFDPKHKLIILSMHTSSQGINLQHGGHRTLFYTLSDDATLFRQAIDRQYRATSKEDCFIEVFCYPDTIDNLRYGRIVDRVEFNNILDKEVTQEDLERLLNGAF